MSTMPFLVKIGMSEEDQKIYLALLALGPLSAGELAKYSGVKSIPKVKEILQKLFEKNYAYQIEGLVDKSIGLYPFREIAAEAEKDSKNIDKLVLELKDYVAKQLAHLEQVMKDTEQHIKAEKTKGTNVVSKNGEENRNSIDQKVTEATNTVTTTAETTKKNISTSASTFLKNQTTTADSFETGSHEKLDVFATNLKSKTETSLQKLSSEIKAKNVGFLTDGKAALETANNEISDKTDVMATSLKDDSKEKMTSTRDHILNGLDSFVNETEGNVSSLNSNLMDTTNTQADNIKSITHEAKKNRIDLNNQFKTGIDESFEKVKENFAQDLNEFNSKFNSKLAKIADKFKNQIDELKDSTVQDIGLLCEEANASLGDLIAKHNEEISANVDLDNKAVEDGSAIMISKITEQNSQALKAIGSTVETLKSSITLLKANYSGAINSRVDETLTSMHTTIDETAQGTKDEYETTRVSITGKLETLTTGNSSETTNVVTKQAQEIKGITDTLAKEVKQNVTDTKTTLMSETKKAKEKIASDTTSGIETIGTTSKTTLTETQGHAMTSIRNNEETSIATINNIANVVETAVRKEITSVKSGLDDYYKRFGQDAMKIAKLLSDFRSDHDSLQNAVKVHPRPLIETAILYSKDAIYDRLTEILTTRIKSNVTMVIPDPTDIPTKIIAKVKPQAKVTIISKIDEIANKAIIDEIKATDALGRIKIRKIGMQDMVGYSEYIAFDIDGGEEMLIAFKDETEKEWVGVLSQSDGFKNVIIGETLGRQALSISRELK
ncbi:MAG TPA: helix-turn-helix domain-containing protein [Candidatus Bathyarchaeia archaeon]|nr:helix-turn-helix domain-containing protein [Candidatus Bathyarchaeia archaeon]